jgi:hypothetical protein
MECECDVHWVFTDWILCLCSVDSVEHVGSVIPSVHLENAKQIRVTLGIHWQDFTLGLCTPNVTLAWCRMQCTLQCTSSVHYPLVYTQCKIPADCATESDRSQEDLVAVGCGVYEPSIDSSKTRNLTRV